DRAAGGVRAADPRRDARRRDAVHPDGRGRRAVVARRRDHRGLAPRPARVPELRGRDVGAALCGRPPAPGRALVATALADWSAQDVAVSDVLRRLGALRQAEGGPELRTNVMTHMAWAPPQWEEAAQQVLEGLAERHPSRTIL